MQPIRVVDEKGWLKRKDRRYKMFKVELKEGTSVFTADDKEVGKINRFILDPQMNEVTHVVVQKGWLLPEDKVVPFEMVDSATEDKVVLNEDIRDFDELPPFEETHYVRVDEEGVNNQVRDDAAKYRTTPGYYWYPPHGFVGFPAYGLSYYTWPRMETQQNIPANTVPLKEGTNVMSSDDEHVGDIERLLVDPDSNQVTHFVISKGLFFKDHKLVPANWISSATEDEVRLTVSSRVLERIPSYKS